MFDEGVAYWTRLQQQGEIESFEPVALEPHGGDLYGFCLLRGDRDTLSRLRRQRGVPAPQRAGGPIVHNFGVVSAHLGQELGREFATYQEQASDLA